MALSAKQAGVASDHGMRWTLAGLSLSMLLSSLGTSIANVALPTFAEAFSASFQQVQWVVLSYLLTITGLVVGAGRLGDMIGRRRLLLIGLFLFVVGSLLCAASPGIGVLIAARAVQGAGAAAMMTLTLSFVSESVPPGRIGSVMGLLGTMSAVGTALGPSLGGFLLATIGWRWIFLVTAILGGAALAMNARYLPASTPKERTGGFNLIGMLLLSVTLTAYALAVTTGKGSFGGQNLAYLLAAVAGAALFVRIERRSTSPLIQLSAVGDPALTGSLATNALITTVLMATLVVGPFFLAQSLALKPAEIGLVMSAGPLVAAVAGVPAGRLADRLGIYPMTLTGLVTVAAGALAMALLPVATGAAGYVVAMAIMTAGYALFQAANNSAVMAGIPADGRGLVSGLLSLSRNLGLITGASLMGAIFALASGMGEGGAAPAGAVAAGLHMTFAVATLLALTALGIALATRSSTVRPAAAI
jgi:EmrB/QacA subfamily drug resistance transporter